MDQGLLTNLAKDTNAMVSAPVTRKALNESNFQFWNKKWGYRNMKYIQSKSQQLQLKFGQKLQIMATIIQTKIEVREKMKKYDAQNKKRESSSQQRQIKEEKEEDQKDKEKQLQFPDQFDQLRQRSQVQSKFSSSQESTFQSRSIGFSMFQSHNKLQSQISYQTCKVHLLKNHIEELQQKLGQELVESQTKIQKQMESKQIMHSYETRIKDMLFNLAGKQNSISIEHTERVQEKTKKRALKNFNDYYLQLMNIRSMCRRLKQGRAQLENLEARNSKKVQETQNQKKESELNERSSLSENKIVGVKYKIQSQKQQKHLEWRKDKENKCLLTEKKNIQKGKAIAEQRICIFKDPFFVKILEMMKSQINRQKSLSTKYKEMKKQFQNLCRDQKGLIAQLSTGKIEDRNTHPHISTQ